ncbi:low temperature requirement protein A [Candidatus Thioglobus sp.]|uniref:low temperature requirement protein A n=1 Tax=Candidatus Thioglobus sp. TaxID=2026721 RepID=UPI003D0F7BA4
MELFYDLIFVVAIASLAFAFHHDYANNHIVYGMISFVMVFLAIWWPWNQYAWFASSFDNNSVSFRLATLWQMVGALVIAVGVEAAFNGDFTIVAVGYVITRLSSIYLWYKVAQDNPKFKITGMRYAIGILLCQIGWITQNFFEFSYFIIAGLWLAEFFVPYYAESHTQTHFHSEHIEERLGLLTIIVLGESILASAYSFKALISHFSYDLLFVSIGCLLTLFGIWWLYFNNSVEHFLRNKAAAFQWGYGHFIIFSAAAAIGALVSVNVDVLTNHGSITIEIANFGFAMSVALYLFGLWFCQERLMGKDNFQSHLMLLVADGVLLLGLLPYTILTTGLLIAATVIYRQYKPLSNS